MVSIIVCSKNPLLMERLIKNIDETIGVPFAVNIIHNHHDKFSISEAYNKGREEAKFNLLVYIHEDIEFKTKGWGKILVDYFNRMEDLGVLGIAGARIKTKAPSGWWDCPKEYWVTHLNQRQIDGTVTFDSAGWNIEEKYTEVAVLDGVFLVTHKKHLLTFDEHVKGFHCYDSDICIEANKRNLKIVVTREILIEHFSKGNAGPSWIHSAHYLHNKNRRHLPMGVFPKMESDNIEQENYLLFVNKCIANKFSGIAFIYWIKLLGNRPFSKRHIGILKSIVSGKPFMPYA